MHQQIILLQGGTAVTPSLSHSAPTPTPTQLTTVLVPTPPKQAEIASSNSNVSAPTTSINRNLDESLTDHQRNHIDELVAKYIAKTKTSKELTAKYRQWHADPRTVSGFNRRWKE